MEPIVATAIVGTGQQSGKEIRTGTAIDLLATQLPESDPERRLLLAGGAWAIYRMAGYMTDQAPEAPQAAAPAHFPACSPIVAHLLRSLLQGRHDELLPEALDLLKKTKQRLPHELLPEALEYGIRHKEIRRALIPVLDERGRWLSQYNPAWSWVAQFISESGEALPDNAETIWQEGTLGQRQEILRRLRIVDPAKAREWLMAVWKQEKAQARSELLATFEQNLSREDEPFLEQVLNDRGDTVRAVAVLLLVHLPTSALFQHMKEHANSMLSYVEGKLTITLSAEDEPASQYDSILSFFTKNTIEKNKPLSRLLNAIKFIPPSHWERHFAVKAAAFIEAVASDKYGYSFIEALSEAAMLSNEQHWFAPLWDWTLQYHSHPMQQQLIQQMSQHDAESRILPLLPDIDREADDRWIEMSKALKKPWSKSFGDAYLQALRTMARSLTHNRTMNQNHWSTALSTAATALPVACFDTALEPWIIPESISWQSHYCQQQIDLFSEKIRIRKQLIEEIK